MTERCVAEGMLLELQSMFMQKRPETELQFQAELYTRWRKKASEPGLVGMRSTAIKEKGRSSLLMRSDALLWATFRMKWKIMTHYDTAIFLRTLVLMETDRPRGQTDAREMERLCPLLNRSLDTVKSVALGHSWERHAANFNCTISQTAELKPQKWETRAVKYRVASLNILFTLVPIHIWTWLLSVHINHHQYKYLPSNQATKN